MYQGDFSNWRDKTGKLIAIYDPATTRSDDKGGFTRDPFPGNKIPAERFSKVAKNVFSYATMRPNTPDPNGILSPNPRNNFITTTGSRTDPWDKFSAKGDHMITQNHRVGFLFQKNRTLQLSVGTPPGLPVPLNNDFQYGDTHTKVYRGTYDWTISPTILNHINFGFNDWGQVRRATNEQYNQGWGTKIGIKNVPNPDLLFPPFSFDEYSPWARGEYGGSYNKGWAGSDDLTLTKGSHTLKFGFLFQEDHYNGYGEHTASGSFGFSRQDTAFPLDQSGNTGNAFASFLLGLVNQGNIETPRFVSDQWKYFAGYAQDDWRVNRKLTLNLGLRYEYTPPTVEGHFPDGYSNFDPRLPNPSAGGRPGAIVFAGSGPGRTGNRSLYNAWPYGFGPRFGAAYSFNEKTVVRISAARSFGSVKNTGGSSHFQGYIVAQGFPRDGLNPAFQLDKGVPDWPKPPTIRPDVLNLNGARGGPNYWQSYDAGRLPEYYNLSFNIQHQLPGNMVTELGYSGALGHHLVSNLVNLNQVDPQLFSGYVNQLGFDNAFNLFNKDISSPEARTANVPIPYAGFRGSVAQALRPFPQYDFINTGGDGGDRSGNSSYHALVAKFERRYSSGLTFLNSYVFSKFFTDAETANANTGNAMDQYNRRLEKALSQSDRTHNFKFSYSYELPFGRGKKYLNSGVLGAVVGNWRIAGIQTYASGVPYGVGPGYGLPLFAGGNRVTVLDYNGWRAEPASGKFDPFKDLWWNPSAFNKTPADNVVAASQYKVGVARQGFGNATRRNPRARGPWDLNESISLARGFQFTESVRLDFRAEAFNLLNRVQWAGPDSSITSNNFGRVTAQANTPRQLQFALKLFF